MNYYVARDCPYTTPKTGGMIGFSHATAKGWDVNLEVSGRIRQLS